MGDDRMEPMETMELMSMGGHQTSGGQTILTAAAKKQGLEALVLEQHDGGRVEAERIPELPHEQSQTVEIANVQDPETGATRQYIVTQMCDSTSAGKQNLETIVEAIRHLEGDHLFSEESGPHQVVKEEVVESCIIDDPDMEIQMTLSSPPCQLQHHKRQHHKQLATGSGSCWAAVSPLCSASLPLSPLVSNPTNGPGCLAVAHGPEHPCHRF